MTCLFARAEKKERKYRQDSKLSKLFLLAKAKAAVTLIMEQRINEVQAVLGRLKENIAELLPSFEETVELQAEKLASKQKKELRKQLKIEQDNANGECKRIRRETEERVKDIGRIARKFAQDFRREHNANLEAIAHKEKVKNCKKIENPKTEARNHTDGEPSSCSELQTIDISEKPDQSDLPRCAACGKESVWLLFCEACRVTRYCNEKCQMRDWKNHQDTCVELKEYLINM